MSVLTGTTLKLSAADHGQCDAVLESSVTSHESRS
jgi:hypothetical protein